MMQPLDRARPPSMRQAFIDYAHARRRLDEARDTWGSLDALVDEQDDEAAAWTRLAALWNLLSEPTPDHLSDDRNRLACEGVSLLCCFLFTVGILLPVWLHGDDPRLLAIAFIGTVASTTWAVLFWDRLSAHLFARLRQPKGQSNG